MIELDEANTDSVTIAVCTFRRDDLFDCMNSLRALNEADRYAVSVVVVDNDLTNKLQTRVELLAEDLDFPLTYVHAPEKNISVARNAALKAADTRWILFIDDDEIADPNWLNFIMQARKGAVAVIGTCETTYAPEYPAWLSRCDFHSNRPKAKVENAYTSNALLDMNFIRKHGLEFRLDLGRTGGEDTVFFRQIHELGGVIKACPEAVVYEPLTPQRASMEWVKIRKYRAGQTHGLLCREFDPKTYMRLPITASIKTGISALMWILSIPGTDRARKWQARYHLHKGVLAYRFRQEILEEYS